MSTCRIFILTGILVAGLLFSAGCTQQESMVKPGSGTSTVTLSMSGTPGVQATPAASDTDSTDSWMRVLLETSMGNITIALDPSMPVTAGNFEALAGEGYYDGVIFHRVIDGFMIQGGDPTGTGRGGPGYRIPDEFSAQNRNDRGTVAMANSGPNTGGSQFFVNLVNNNYLDTKHPVFGRVVDGMDVVDAIGKVPTTGRAGGDRPLRNVTIIRGVMI